MKSLGAREGTVRNSANGNEGLRSNIIGASYPIQLDQMNRGVSNLRFKNYLDLIILENIQKIFFVSCKWKHSLIT